MSETISQSVCPFHRRGADDAPTRPHEHKPQTPAANRSLPVRVAILAYGVLAYVLFLVAFLYAMGFVANAGVPKGIDSGVPGSLLVSLAINTALLSLFVVQHTIMARRWFKQRFTRVFPAAVERSTFVLAASVSLLLLFGLWRPLPTIVWEVTNPVTVYALVGISLCGWAIVLIASFMVSHFDLFGLRQTWFAFRGQEYRPIGFRVVGLYKVVRHPLMLGFLLAFWSTPVMSVGHLFFAVMVTGYIALGVTLEERDLIREFGEHYRQYRRHVPSVIPLPRLRPGNR